MNLHQGAYRAGVLSMPDDQALPLMLGEMKGQMRELIHNFNNLAQRVEDLIRTVDRTAHLPAVVEEIKADMAALNVRVTALEAIEHQRRGAFSLGAALVKMIPWLVPAGVLGGAAALVSKAAGL